MSFLNIIFSEGLIMSESTRKGEKPLFSIFVWFSLMHQEECFTVNCGGGGEGHIMMICAGFNLNLSFKLI